MKITLYLRGTLWIVPLKFRDFYTLLICNIVKSTLFQKQKFAKSIYN